MKKNPSQAAVRARVFYTGRVQGVGFRYTAERLALGLGLSGLVKNLSDGRVELVCEGPQDTIETLLAQVKQDPALGRHIRGVACAWEKPTGEFTDFRVEFDY